MNTVVKRIYDWRDLLEGLNQPIDSKGKRVGRGHLEITGYAAVLRL